jgi:gamma-glutamyl-gamma-aminobutyrate hydrolase PuuD
VVGLQCHPEELYLEQEWARQLFTDFVVASRA